jgi:hypothetical protein
VGNCVAKEVDLTILPKGDIPRMAEIHVWVRPVADGIETDWLHKGVFYIDVREIDRVSGCMTIHGYDAMLKLEQVYIEDGEELTGWPKAMNVVAADIAALIGVNLAVFNLLPVPALDGCKVVFCLIEWIFKKPVNRKVEAIIHAVGIALLFAFAILVDILHFV